MNRTTIILVALVIALVVLGIGIILYVYERQFESNTLIESSTLTTLAEITEPQYTMVCIDTANPYYGKTELKVFKKTISGFEVYFMDDSWAWLSSGNACVIREFYGLD